MSQITAVLSARAVDHSHDLVATGARRPRGLDELVEREDAVITRVVHGSDAATARRLFDLGFTPGATVRKVRRAPFDGPSIYRVADYEIALRPEQARTIQVDTATTVA